MVIRQKENQLKKILKRCGPVGSWLPPAGSNVRPRPVNSDKFFGAMIETVVKGRFGSGSKMAAEVRSPEASMNQA